MIGAGALERSHAGDHALRVAVEAGVQRLGKLAESEAGRHRRYGFLGGVAGAPAPFVPDC